ncbi:MAG TPA: 4'-phosphopantetheinyl transferase superfamily protein [Gemmatimonadales bacterium]|nr:4'-phosphopantetheinyl transferase superfamily protein [Gemmatimonadales bacterium]
MNGGSKVAPHDAVEVVVTQLLAEPAAIQTSAASLSDAERALPDADPIAARFFSRREQAAYRALDPDERPLGFFQCWTRKEAFIKALGEGFSHRLDSFDVSLVPGEPAQILRIDDARGGDERGWGLESLTPAPGFVAAVVAEEP